MLEKEEKSTVSGTKKRSPGRPRIEIDKKNFEYLLACGCNLKMIAGYFSLNLGSCSEDTIERWCKREYGKRFADVQALFREGGKTQIMMKQMEVALSGDTKMLIWLGKVKLGQSETKAINTDETKLSQLYKVLDDEEGEV